MKIERERLAVYGVFGAVNLYPEGERPPFLEVIKELSLRIEAAILGGMTMFQLREKGLTFELFLKEAVEIGALCGKYGIPFIVNDNPQICLEARADGVHLGEEDCKISEARKLLGETYIIGATAHNREEALRAEGEGADYLGSGAAFGSFTKKVKGAIDLSEYDRITKAVNIPVVAIGGINVTNIRKLSGRGLAGAAAGSGIFGNRGTALSEITENVKRLKDISLQKKR